MSETAQTVTWRRPPPLSLIRAVKRVFRKVFAFSGRARPAEFWKFVLFWFVVNIGLIVVWSYTVGPEILTAQVPADDGTTKTVFTGRRYNGGRLADIFNLICLIPLLSLTSRRLHDVNRSGWWMALPMVWPIVLLTGLAIVNLGLSTVIEAITSGLRINISLGGYTFFILLVLIFTPVLILFIQLAGRGTPGPNRFGPNPIEVTK